MPENNKVLLVGWDAADWRVIDPLMDQGKMPNLKHLIENGVRGNLATIEPVFSPMLWTSIATGKRAYKHGVLGFLEPDPYSGTVRPVTSYSRKTKALWNILNQEDKQSIVVGWWPSHPVEHLSRGVVVSNHFQRSTGTSLADWKLPPETIHPRRLKNVLSELRFHPSELAEDVMFTFLPALADMEQRQLDEIRTDPRLKSVMTILAECTTIHSAATALMQNEKWDFAAVYYDAIDHFCHGFMKYHPPKLDWIPSRDFAIWKDVVESGYRFHDMMLGTLVALAGEDTSIFICSDHGFHPDHMRPRGIPQEPAGPAHEHRHLGILAAKGPGIRKDELIFGASLLDICPTVLHQFGLPVGDDMDGKVLLDIWELPDEPKTVPTWDMIDGDHGQHPPRAQISAGDCKAAVDRLVALGYIDNPDAIAGSSTEDTLRELDYNLACSYLDAGLFTEALLLLEWLYQQCPMDHRFGTKLRFCYQNLGRVRDLRRVTDSIITRRLEEARIAADELHALIPDDPSEQEREKRRVEAMTEQERLRHQRTLRTLSEKAHPNHFTLNYLDAYADFFGRNYDTALKKLDQLDDNFGARRNSISLRGDIYLRRREWKKARAAYEQALKIDNEMPGPYLGLARAALGDHDFDKASDYARRSIGLFYHQPQAHYLLGVAHYRKHEWQIAENSFLTCVRQAPLAVKPYLMLGRIARNYKGNTAETVQYQLLGSQARKRLQEERQRCTSTVGDTSAPSPRLPPLCSRSDQPQDIPESRIITVVTGLPRSGTSLMMQMLAAAGIPSFYDHHRPGDESNPLGYFEKAEVATLLNDNRDRLWLASAQGKALKVIAPMLPALPLQLRRPGSEAALRLHYRVIFMERDMREILDSQNRMLMRLVADATQNESASPANAYIHHVITARAWVRGHGISAIAVDYNNVLGSPSDATKPLAAFLCRPAKADVMAKVVDSTLYRCRRKNGS